MLVVVRALNLPEPAKARCDLGSGFSGGTCPLVDIIEAIPRFTPY